MTTLITTPDLIQDAVSEPPGALESVTLQGVPWSLYCQLRDLPENRHKRMIYNRGTLVIISPTSKRHERLSLILNLMILDWGDERDIEIEHGGTMTFRREDQKQGLEPDQSYFIRHAVEFLETETDMATDPPPDLVLEVDVTSPSDLKLPVYAAMKVPEVWIWKADRLQPLMLSDGQYVEATESVQLPGFPLTDALRILTEHWSAGQRVIRREFRTFVRTLIS